MALIKSVQTPHGIEASYHKIVKIEYLINESLLVIVVAIYASEAARDAGSAVLWHEYVRIPFEQMAMDPRLNFYQVLAGWTESYLHGAERDSRPDPVPEVTPEPAPLVDEAPVPPLEQDNA